MAFGFSSLRRESGARLLETMTTNLDGPERRVIRCQKMITDPRRKASPMPSLILWASPLLCAIPGCLLPLGDRVDPPRRDEYVGVWIGKSVHGGSGAFYRLELRPNATGTLGANPHEANHPACVYEITKWTLDEYKLRFQLSPITELRGKARWDSFEIEVPDPVYKPNKYWITMTRENEALDSIEILRTKMNPSNSPQR